MIYTISKLAKRLGIAPTSVRNWIKCGYIEQPPLEPVTEARGYSDKAADRIEHWYLQRLLDGKTRGVGAEARRAAAVVRIKELAETEAETSEADSVE